MRTIVHLSDLHFGRVDPAIPPVLLAAVAEVRPALVVVSGDFTQRARVREFKEAAAFLAGLASPVLVVPGNHDVPLYDVMRRWLAPLRRYRRFIADELMPSFVDEEIAVLGINTARALTFKNGRINREQLAAAAARLEAVPTGVIRIVVTHHPFDLGAGAGVGAGHDPLGRAEMAIAGFLAARVDMILSGHLHRAHVGESAQRYPMPGRVALLVQAGTATSTRQRGEVNSFNVIRIAAPTVEIDCMLWDAAGGRFVVASTEHYMDSEAGWVRRGAA